MLRNLCFCLCLFLGATLTGCKKSAKNALANEPRKIEILFLGHNNEHHNSARFMPMLASALSKEGINLTYTDNVEDLNEEHLSWYDGLILYANHDSIQGDQEKALLDFVADGKGFIPVHCASFCFRNSPEYVELVGGQFHKHDTGTFTVSIVNKEHPAMQQVNEFSTWDETYVHQQLSEDRTVLMERVEGDRREPWTWIKEHGKGRVFYTAYGHDERTWENPGFHQLIREGIIWAVGDQVKDLWETFKKDMPVLTYREEANIPNYEKRDPAPKYQEPLSPGESKKLIQVPAGFRLELFAAEPDIINPIAMAWDERGRLWVIETVDYPNTVRDQEGVGDDRIKICEDTDGDGKADKFTVFADDLNIPTSLVFANGGVIVSQAPYFLFLKDNDGDDQADERKIIMEGWGTFDTHAGPSNLQYGFDNMIWGAVGYSGFKGILVGQSHEFAQGLYRFSTDASRFEFLTGTSNNTWGLGLTENNDVFASTANNTHSVFMGIPDKAARGVEGIPVGSIKIDGHYAMHPITEHVRQVDVFGGFTAASGHHFYTAREYPEKFWNKVAFVCEPTGHLVHMAIIEKDGAGFQEKDGWNLFSSADEWVSPVEAKVGPDGAVWILDWYNFIVQHNPTPTPNRGGYAAVNGAGNAYENPLRDKTHGRIWKVVHQDAKSYKPLTLSKDDPEELVNALGHGNMFWRTTAQRLLVERASDDVLPRLYDLIKNQDADASGYNYAVVHALWVIQGLDVLHHQPEALKVVSEALRHPSPGVRKAAIQILSSTHWSEQLVSESGILSDKDPNTRLAAILSLVELPSSDNVGKTLYALSQEESIKQDNWLSKAVYVAANKHSNGFVSAFMQAHPDYNSTVGKTDQNRESPGLDDSSWKNMDVPTLIEQAGLDIDGIIWFRKTIDLPDSWSGKKGTISLGPVDDSDETYINGKKVGSTESSWDKKRMYTIPSGVLKGGRNIIAVRVQDNSGGGGIYGNPNDLYIQCGNAKESLIGNWKFEVEKEFNSANQNAFGEASIGEVFVKHYKNKTTSGETTSTPALGGNVILIKSIQNEMKFDLRSFTVEAGKAVEIVFENPDFMQHNLVITKPGALEIVGRAADKLASNPKGAEMNYVPEMPEVLFHSKLVNPQGTETIRFIAPSQPGDYPFVCTFPGHWSIMNGIMKVVKAKTAL